MWPAVNWVKLSKQCLPSLFIVRLSTEIKCMLITTANDYIKEVGNQKFKTFRGKFRRQCSDMKAADTSRSILMYMQSRYSWTHFFNFMWRHDLSFSSRCLTIFRPVSYVWQLYNNLFLKENSLWYCFNRKNIDLPEMKTEFAIIFGTIFRYYDLCFTVITMWWRSAFLKQAIESFKT